MKLEKFKEKNPVHTGMIIVSTILVLLTAALILYKSFALYEQKNSFEIINGQVPDQNYDAMLSFYVDDGNGNQSFVESMPTENGHNYEVTVSCDNGATGEWNYETWGPNIQNVTTSRTKCKLIFVKSDTVIPISSGPTFLTSGKFSGYGSWSTKTFNLGDDYSKNYKYLIFSIIGSNDGSFTYISSLSYKNCKVAQTYNSGNIDRGQLITAVLSDITGVVSCTLNSASPTSSKDYAWSLYGIK